MTVWAVCDLNASHAGLQFQNGYSDTGSMMAKHGLPQGTLGASSQQDVWNDLSRVGDSRDDWSGVQTVSGSTTVSNVGLNVFMDEESERDLAQVWMTSHPGCLLCDPAFEIG